MNGSNWQRGFRLALVPLFLGLHLAVAPASEIRTEGETESVPAIQLSVQNLTAMAARLTWTNPVGTTQFQVQLPPAANDGPGLNLIIGDLVQVAQSQFVIVAPEVSNGNYILLPGMSYTWRVRTTSKLTSAGENDRS